MSSHLIFHGIVFLLNFLLSSSVLSAPVFSWFMLGFSPAVPACHGDPPHPGGRSLYPPSISIGFLQRCSGEPVRAHNFITTNLAVSNRRKFAHNFSPTSQNWINYSARVQLSTIESGVGSFCVRYPSICVKIFPHNIISSRCSIDLSFHESLSRLLGSDGVPASKLTSQLIPDDLYRRSLPTCCRSIYRSSAASVKGLYAPDDFSSCYLEHYLSVYFYSSMTPLCFTDLTKDYGSRLRRKERSLTANLQKRKLGQLWFMDFGLNSQILRLFHCPMGLKTQMQLPYLLMDLNVFIFIFWGLKVLNVWEFSTSVYVDCMTDKFREVDRGRRPVYIETLFVTV